MNRFIKCELSKILIFAAVTMFTACGDETTNVTETGIPQLAKGEALPNCDSAAVGEMLYVADSGAVYICGESGWQSLNGKDGADGKDGEKSVDSTDVFLRDTVTFSSMDTILARDTLFQMVSASFLDTLVLRDTLFGQNGESCTAEMLSDGSGYKIVCGGDSVGVVLNGLDGEKGDVGAEGPEGVKGNSGSDASCSLSDDGQGTLTLVCGTSTTKLYKAVCGNTPYDRVKSFCLNGNLYSCGDLSYNPLESFCYTGGTKDTIVSLCNGETYDLLQSFCYDKGTKDTIVVLCGGAVYDLDAAFCYEDILYTCGGKAYDPTKSFCSGNSIFTYCGGTTTYNAENQFCDLRDFHIYSKKRIGTDDFGYRVWMTNDLALTPSGYARSVAFRSDNSGEYALDNGSGTYWYSWAAAMDSEGVYSNNGKGCGYGKTCVTADTVRGLCPEGWHLPSADEWRDFYDLVDALGGNHKEVLTNLGFDPTYPGYFDASGFELDEDEMEYGDFYDYIGTRAYYWSASEVDNALDARYYVKNGMRLNGNTMSIIEMVKTTHYSGHYHSIRCIENNSFTPPAD